MKKTVVLCSLIFLFLFAGITVMGICMVCKEINTSKENEDYVAERSGVKVDAIDSFSFELTNVTPGLIIAVLGAVLFALMLRKVPVKEIIEYQTKDSSHDKIAGATLVEEITSENIIKVPLPVWWLLRFSKKLIRVEPYA